MIGMVMLMGLVTKNAILLVDYTNQCTARRGSRSRDALLKAGPVRLRPILMTTLAMILGMLPSAIGKRRGRRVPRADFDRDHRRPDHLDAAHAGGRSGVVPVAGAVHGADEGVARASACGAAPRRARRGRRHPHAPRSAGCWPSPMRSGRARPRAAGSVVAGCAWRSDWSCRSTGRCEIALDAQRVAEGRVRGRSCRRRARRRGASGVPAIGGSVVPIHAGAAVPGDSHPCRHLRSGRTAFQAAFTRQNIMQLNLVQPLYTGGRLRTLMRHRPRRPRRARLSLDRSRQELQAAGGRDVLPGADERTGRAGRRRGRPTRRQLPVAGAKARFEAGTAARLDVLRAEVEVANAQRALIRAQSAVGRSRTRRCAPCCRCRRSTTLALKGTLDDGETLPDAGDPACHARRPPGPAGPRRPPADRRRYSVALANARVEAEPRLDGQPAVPGGRHQRCC